MLNKRHLVTTFSSMIAIQQLVDERNETFLMRRASFLKFFMRWNSNNSALSSCSSVFCPSAFHFLFKKIIWHACIMLDYGWFWKRGLASSTKISIKVVFSVKYLVIRNQKWSANPWPSMMQRSVRLIMSARVKISWYWSQIVELLKVEFQF